MGMEMFCVMRVSVGLIRTHIWWEPPLWIFWWEHFTGGQCGIPETPMQLATGGEFGGAGKSAVKQCAAKR